LQLDGQPSFRSQTNIPALSVFFSRYLFDFKGFLRLSGALRLMGRFSTVLLVEFFGDNHLPLRPAQALRLRSHEIQFSPVVLRGLSQRQVINLMD
jgi:hypothetical protein